MAATVVVIGRNYTARLGMIRAVGMAGYKVVNVIIGTMRMKAVDSSSKYISRNYYTGFADEAGLLKLLMSDVDVGNEPAVLIPTDDYTAAFIDNNHATLSERYLTPAVKGNQGGIAHLMEKGVQKKLALQAGLTVAKGWDLSHGESGYQIPDDILYPCFVKPQSSVKGSKFLQKKCDTREELEKHLQNNTCDFLAEQYIEIEKEYDIPGFADDTEVIIPSVIKKNLIVRGITGNGTLHDGNEFRDTIERLREFVRLMHFTGLIDIEVYESHGTLYFNELNLRYGTSGYAMTGAGINLPEIMIKALLNEAYTAEWDPSKYAGKTFSSERVCLIAYSEGKKSWKQYEEMTKKSDFCFIKNDADPAPYRRLQLFYPVIRATRKIGLLH